MLGVTPLAALNIMPSGGISPSNVSAWWDAGAVGCGIGRALVGADVSLPVTADPQDVAVRSSLIPFTSY